MATEPADAAYTGYMLAVLFVLPSDEGLGTDNRDSIENRWKPSTLSAAFSASSRVFGLNGEANRVRKKQSSAIIAADVRRT